MKNLLCVKSIMTVCLTVMLCVMVYMRPDDYGDVFKNIVVMVATFYFSYQAKKVDNNEKFNKDNVSDDSNRDNLLSVHGKVNDDDSGN